MEPNIIDEIVKLAFSILAPILAAAVTALAVQLLRKVGIELDMTKKAVVEQQLGDLVALTEEWAAVKIKAGLPVSAADKANHFLALAVDYVPGVSADEATKVAKTILGRFKVAATGAVSDVRSAVEAQ